MSTSTRLAACGCREEWWRDILRNVLLSQRIIEPLSCRTGRRGGERIMPGHEWTRVTAGMFHDFHSAWITELRNVLISVGRTLPDMSLFLTSGHYIYVPLEETYMAAWRGVPQRS